MKTLLSLLLLFTAVSATAIPVEQLKTDTKVLASDAFEGREPGSPGETKTINYLVKRMTEIGLKPGNNGQWTQDVPTVSITTAPTPLLIAGGKAPMTLVSGPDVAKVYHTPSDEYSDDWDWAGALQDLDMFREFSVDLPTARIGQTGCPAANYAPSAMQAARRRHDGPSICGIASAHCSPQLSRATFAGGVSS